MSRSNVASSILFITQNGQRASVPFGVAPDCSHSLMAFATYIIGPTPFPEFSAVVMLDDIQVMYYDSISRKAVHCVHNGSTCHDEEQSEAGVIFRDMYSSMKGRAFFLKDHLNHTDGVHVHQRLAGCELLNNDNPGLLRTWDAFDQQKKEQYNFNAEKNNFQVELSWKIWDNVKSLRMKFLYENVYHPICIKVLQRYLKMRKNEVMRIVKPRVRLLKKKVSRGLQMTCLATGFYPRHINLTLFRDGEPVDEDRITGGVVLPNGDGTYQMRKSVVISGEELEERCIYNCTVKQLILDNKLDLTFVSDVAENEQGSPRVYVVSGAVLLFGSVIFIAGLVLWKRRHLYDSHSLMALATYIFGQTPFPEFSVVVMLDDLQIAYYDSTKWITSYRSQSNSKYYEEEQKDANIVFRDMFYDMRDRALFLKDQQNHTDGVHVHQRLVGCDILNNDKPGPIHYWDAFGGQNMEEFVFDIDKHSIQIKRPWLIMWDDLKRVHENLMYTNVYHPICIKILRRYLSIERNNVMKKVKPRVRLLKKKVSRGLQMTCLATGFYPRHINLTLFRDGEPVDEDRITGGVVLPNGDGTYQMRKSVVISGEELEDQFVYNCTANYLNFDNKLDIVFDAGEHDFGSFSLSVVVCFLLFVFGSIFILIAVIVWRKRQAGSGSSQHDYDRPRQTQHLEKKKYVQSFKPILKRSSHMIPGLKPDALQVIRFARSQRVVLWIRR
ncbi:hypothetical protein DNTS_028450 [Danionella cerebrum]|uniref:Ig-like domain-containing protein n=1 Tax=Danionella cerebrum TaxID=2873325 RepID=A0A553MZT3_9TELE|nr:hypothetical protein DNTS_028450 [Danionella translucida]